MEISFITRKLQKQCSQKAEMVKTFGSKMAAKLSQRLMELRAADNLSDVSCLPPPRCHELTNRKGIFSVDLEHPYRLLFSPDHDPVPLREDGGIALDHVTRIIITTIEDTHDSKNKRRG